MPGCSGSAEPEKKDGVLEVKAEPGSDGEAAVKQEADVKHEGEGHGHTHGHETDLDSDAEGHEEAEEDDVRAVHPKMLQLMLDYHTMVLIMNCCGNGPRH